MRKNELHGVVAQSLTAQRSGSVSAEGEQVRTHPRVCVEQLVLQHRQPATEISDNRCLITELTA